MRYISVNTNIQEAIEAIDDDRVDPIVDTGKYIYMIDTSLRQFGTVIYTQFTADTHFPLKSYSVKYGNQHIIRQMLTTLLKKEIIPVRHTELPLPQPSVIDPTIIPSFY